MININAITTIIALCAIAATHAAATDKPIGCVCRVVNDNNPNYHACTTPGCAIDVTRGGTIYRGRYDPNPQGNTGGAVGNGRRRRAAGGQGNGVGQSTGGASNTGNESGSSAGTDCYNGNPGVSDPRYDCYAYCCNGVTTPFAPTTGGDVPIGD